MIITILKNSWTIRFQSFNLFESCVKPQMVVLRSYKEAVRICAEIHVLSVSGTELTSHTEDSIELTFQYFFPGKLKHVYGISDLTSQSSD